MPALVVFRAYETFFSELERLPYNVFVPAWASCAFVSTIFFSILV